MYWDYSDKLLLDGDLEWLTGPLRMLGKREHDQGAPKSNHPSAEIFDSSGFDDGGYFDATDSSGETHWCYAYDRTAEAGFMTYHFILHGECLSILECALATYNFHYLKPSLDDFYDALCAVMETDGPGGVGLPLSNGHFGAAQFWDQDWEAKKGWEFIVANPNIVPDATHYIVSHLHRASPEDRQSEVAKGASASDRRSPRSLTEGMSGLQSLPPEILSQIESNLPIQGACSLRLTSRRLAARIQLTQAFWQRRLIAGELFGLTMLDRDALGCVEKGRDWRRLVKTLATYESFFGEETGRPKELWGEMHDAPIGLKNHMRIWKIITGLLDEY
ncbi:hypothetical protein LTR09_012560 [Extremus antarcticus]|uniref:F-box domain-containing protein n=1 Tax=Extremus antarcticus TaxID=702011 RepID=A0AAJ0D4X1_9PEZI|nr:hypothetical protein LTR09_012560 [Extremus antarcticus]